MFSSLKAEFMSIQSLLRHSLYKKRNSLKRPQKKITIRLPGLWAGLRKGDCYLPGIYPTKKTMPCVYTGSHPDQKNICENDEN